MPEESKKILRAKDVMNSNIHYIDGMATAEEAAEMMRQKKADTLLVTKRHPDDAVGMVAVQDLIRKVMLTERSPLAVNVYEIMTKPVISVPANMDLRYAVRLMARADIRRAPVEENGEYIGLVSFTELIMGKFVF
jgi:signal-transduction protein with cAMP-binding, CBS, and nucleotidyltransferase domain